jgi:hypothetical protein
MNYDTISLPPIQFSERLIMSKKKKNNGRPDIKALRQKSLSGHVPIQQKKTAEGHQDNNWAIKYR